MRIFPSPSMAALSIFLWAFLLSLPPSSQQDLSTDRAALLSLRSAVGGRTFRWNVSQLTPCNWAGVTCEADRVTVLRLPGVALSGRIPEGIFGNLTRLRTLSLRLNSLVGSLPSDLSRCSDLRHLYLQGNMFSGEIPSLLFGLRDLVRINLAGNNFTGEISPGFNNLTRLKTLYLENNQLSGSLPDLDLPLDQFNVSNNMLNGSIPNNLRKFESDSFLGTSLCGKPLDVCPDEGTVPSQPTSSGRPGTVDEKEGKKKKKLSGGAIAGIVIGCVVGFALLVLILMVLCRKKGKERSRAVDIPSIKQQEVEIPGDKPAGEAAESANYGSGYSVAAAAAAAMTGNAKGGEANGSGAKKLVFFGNATRVFDLEDLLRASAEVLGKGTFGTAYKAVLDATTVVAVKRLKDVTMEEREFREKIEAVGAMDHENLVPLRAYYYSRDEKLLVYDFMPMGSLSALLHGNKGGGRSPLSWEMRAGIALGAARGLNYLHSQCSHGNVKSSNILLSKANEARVSDFGLAQLVGLSSATPNRGTGYRAPEVTDPKRVSQKADVYSFGVVLLELITGKAPGNSEEGVDLPRWVLSEELRREELFDSELLSHEAEAEEMLQLGIECTAQHPDKRPTMDDVVTRIMSLKRTESVENEGL
ncbi:PREDICTED: probable inactive receptor kinase At1g48480 [Tarenaya hassleriana]|uniref:probable inactive receptor kinase At1g48480 n=1 Tax=Tarenaya hassleriana TaxID=28532 RepID=UPI00053C72C0|nr:PREDICTED: probable inactive receptor kinase At1g48480 [Tarenaya hassleriana]